MPSSIREPDRANTHASTSPTQAKIKQATPPPKNAKSQYVQTAGPSTLAPYGPEQTSQYATMFEKNPSIK
ncbi:hypothetical protein A1F94_011536 [Pyrenophora tritici-repentis]|nr:hypothetical protein PtrV1_13934 [Pyrenophora tritici-repentis]KAG9378420.1 hypothetical protein A1F94_011536 [Pyrenophora tritici-repentis]KAI0609831.1 hypothetical protein TUN205_05932 [Pyrenophora tritici-repentis]KAI0622377.1 hypothetical protein TUN199_05638 [Pyrenophora tritici-repentis]PZD38284.1 hypothetical protein A1F97_06861 [Pyrenophora tritici-repentis]